MAETRSVLAILMSGFEELEVVAPIDVLRRAGVRVVVASLHSGLSVTGRNGMTLLAETTVTEALKESWDLVFLPGGPGVKHLRADPRIGALVKSQLAAKKPVAAICAAPTVLQDAGVLAGKHYTAHPSVASELKEILAGRNVVEDGLIITSRGAGTALEFGLALVARLVSPAKATEVKQSICG